MTIQFKRRLATTVFGAAALISAVAASHAQEAKPLDKAAVEKIVREYLIANPEVMLEVQDALEEKQAASARDSQSRLLQKIMIRFSTTPMMPFTAIRKAT